MGFVFVSVFLCSCLPHLNRVDIAATERTRVAVVQTACTTPLFIASQQGHVRIVQRLIAAKANVDHIATVR